ncbi:uncharacterized protein [Spinacia oleracea]|uniref:Ubiquitin-like protease family profile domain-containing protein n=1 Tax=Spinacia oleracea TaxID=3562 RepID=A0ABM3R033_SPIOL|nr:uncharacterized protein LOC130463778 [Spinacia oleracea]XP_056688987.1 uncharacterized protein LOC130463778 [Spinacia oleracea]
MLLVIYTTINTVHVFDSIKKKRSLAIRLVALDSAFKTYNAHGGKSKGSQLQRGAAVCSQQDGGTECGYYTSRFMDDIVHSYSGSENLFKDFKQLNLTLMGKFVKF